MGQDIFCPKKRGNYEIVAVENKRNERRREGERRGRMPELTRISSFGIASVLRRVGPAKMSILGEGNQSESFCRTDQGGGRK